MGTQEVEPQGSHQGHPSRVSSHRDEDSGGGSTEPGQPWKSMNPVSSCAQVKAESLGIPQKLQLKVDVESGKLIIKKSKDGSEDKFYSHKKSKAPHTCYVSALAGDDWSTAGCRRPQILLGLLTVVEGIASPGVPTTAHPASRELLLSAKVSSHQAACAHDASLGAPWESAHTSLVMHSRGSMCLHMCVQHVCGHMCVCSVPCRNQSGLLQAYAVGWC